MAFTLEQIEKVHNELGNANTLSDYARGLNALGVLSYDSYVTDGHSVYYGKNGYSITSPALHEVYPMAKKSDIASFQEIMRRSQAGKIGYEDMVKGLAHSGIEKWTMDTEKMTFTYTDVSGAKVLIEELTD